MKAKLDGWYSETGAQSDVVLFTRCDIARNISGFLFPISLNKEASEEIVSLAFSFFDTLKDTRYFTKLRLDTLDPLSVKLFEERGILFNAMPAEPEKAVIIHNNESLYICINTEDHVNISSFTAGFDVYASLSPAAGIEARMQEYFTFSAAKESGFITSDITKIGSGIKFSVLCSLPGIFLSDKIGAIVEFAKASGLNISGYYASNSKNSLGFLFAVSTAVCAGGDENSQLTEFVSAVQNIIDQERSLRKIFAEEHKLKIEDMISRASAIFKYAKLMEFKEAADIIFKIKLGLNLNLLDGITNEQCNSMLFKMQMGHLALSLLSGGIAAYGKDINETSIEEYRAAVIKSVCSKIKIK